MDSFDELCAQALAAPFSGWDLSWLAARSTHGHLRWDYPGEVTRHARGASSMLDMGTGGGERLAALPVRPARTAATECWRPNVPVAAHRLRPLGVGVVECEGAPDNMDQAAPGKPSRAGALPFADAAFDLVINRHEAFRADQVYRVLAPGGTFITQQVDNHSYDDLYRLLGLAPPDEDESWLPLACDQLSGAGLTVTAARHSAQVHSFNDIAAVVYYLRVLDWAIPGYSFDAFRHQLHAAHADSSRWPLPVRQHRFLVIATKPAS